MGPASTVEVMSQMRLAPVVQTLTAGVDDVLATLPDGVTLCNAAGVHDASTAELAVGLDDRQPAWVSRDFFELRTRALGCTPAMTRSPTVGCCCIGAGSVGAAIAERLAPVRGRAAAGGHAPLATASTVSTSCLACCQRPTS